MQEKFKIRVVQMSFSPELHTCKCEELKQREKRWCHDFLHEIVTNYKHNQVNAQLRRKMRGKRDVTCCWFDQNPLNAQLNKLDQHYPFIWRSEQVSIEGIGGYICYLLDEDRLCYGKEAAVTNHQMQWFSSSLMNSFQSKEDVELFQKHNMEEIDIQILNDDHMNVKVFLLSSIS